MKKDMNLYRKYKRTMQSRTSLTEASIYIALAIAFLLIITAFGVRYRIENHLLNHDVKELRTYVTNEARVKDYEQAKALADEAQQLNTFKTVLEELDAVFVEKDAISSRLLSEIYTSKPSDLKIDNLSANGSEVEITYHSTKESSSASFVRSLKLLPIVKELNYSGYTYEDSDETYNGTISIVLEGAY